MTYDGDEIALSPCFDLEDRESAVCVLIRHPLDSACESLEVRVN